MSWDRWVVPPAVSAAAFAMLAISPPVGAPPASLHRLESLGSPAAGRPWLLRALVAAGAPVRGSFRLGSPGVGVERIVDLRGQGEWFRVLVPPRSGEVRLSIVDAAGGRSVRTAVGPRAPAASDPSSDERVQVVEGILVPELVGEVIVEPPGSSVDLLPVTDQVAIEPSRRTVDACGLASFSVRVSGLGAPASMVSTANGLTRRDELRLPMVPGGIAVRDDGDTLVLRATSPGVTAHVVAGDRLGPTWWSATTLGDEGDEGAARVPVPPGILWITASHASDLTVAVSPLIRSSRPPCHATPLGRRVARGRLAPPPLPALVVLWDGPSASRHLTQQRIRGARVLCVAGLAASVLLEVVLLLGAGLAKGPTPLRALTGDRRNRLGVLVAGISTLLLMGVAMGLAVGLRGP